MKRWLRNRKAEMGMNVAFAVIGIVIAVTVVANLLPQALVDISNETTWAGAPTSVITLITIVVPIVIVAGLILLILKVAKGDS